MPMADFSMPIRGRARLGDAQMQRIVTSARAAAGRPPWSSGTLEHFTRDADVVKVEVVQQARRGRRRSPPAPRAVTPPYFASSGFSSEPPLTPMRMGMPRCAAGLGHRLHPLLRADVAGVDADLVRPRPRRTPGPACSQSGCPPPAGCGWRSLMSPTASRRRHVRHRHPDDLAPRLLQAAGSAPRWPPRRRCAVLHMDWMRNRRAAAHGHARPHGSACSFRHLHLNSFQTSWNVMTTIRSISSAKPARWT